MTTQSLKTMWQPEPQTNLVESIPVKEGVKLSVNETLSDFPECSWEDLRGLSWILMEDWF